MTYQELVQWVKEHDYQFSSGNPHLGGWIQRADNAKMVGFIKVEVSSLIMTQLEDITSFTLQCYNKQLLAEALINNIPHENHINYFNQ